MESPQCHRGLYELGSGFNPEVGFYCANSFENPRLLVLYHLRMNGWGGLLELRPHISYRSYWNYDNHRLETSFHIDNHWEWESGVEVHTGNQFTEGVENPFEISSGVFVPAGSYSHHEGQPRHTSPIPAKIAFSLDLSLVASLVVIVPAIPPVSMFGLAIVYTSEWGINSNIVRLPYGDFNTNIPDLAFRIHSPCGSTSKAYPIQWCPG